MCDSIGRSAAEGCMGFRCRPAHDSGCGGHPLLGGRQQAGWIEPVSSYPRVGSVNFVDAMFH